MSDNNQNNEVTPEQFRAARSLLGLDVRQICDEIGISTASLRRAERDEQIKPSTKIIVLLTLFYEQRGIEFLFEDGVGVRRQA
ncbi:hypothetical protein C7964_102377 [Loktanella sp. PT4BL]|uniref:hypothetical protein n=1 Tax=Loktanella sp. PT4BL TaxID=2135611 RepID=UPI000D900CD4|nr:hypothetical protein [Loktanella sp. PT4BL]PXW70487.1 hypothetical protein C7964_102377 [Loktanella sp. PT4BL]